jgi:hypothetical protein
VKALSTKHLENTGGRTAPRWTEFFYTVDGSRKDAEAFASAEYNKLKRLHERKARGLPGRVRFSTLLKEFRRWARVHLRKNAADAYEDTLKVFEIYFLGRVRDDGSMEGPIVEKPGTDPWVDDLITADWTRFLTWRHEYRLGKPLKKAAPRRSRARSGTTPDKPRLCLQRLWPWDCGATRGDFIPGGALCLPKYVDMN